MACPLSGGCLTNKDCQSNGCVGNTCAQPSCTDQVKDGLETGVDCGGPACPACGAGQGCVTSTDCAAPITCGGGGASGVCGCIANPKTTTCAGLNCGVVVDNCGAQISCGSCAAPYTCGSGSPSVPHVCGCPLPGGCMLNTIFGKRYGSINDDDAGGITVSGSSVIIGGSFISSIDLGGGVIQNFDATKLTDDAYVAKLDLSGDLIWAKRFGDASPQLTRAITSDATGNVYLGLEN
jgi:hypothetical protein